MSGVKKLLSSASANQDQAENNVDNIFNVTSYTNDAAEGNYNYTTGGHLINTFAVGQHKRLETGVDLRGSSSLDTDQYWASTRYTGSGYPREFDLGIDLANNNSMTWIRGFLGTTGGNEMRGGMFDSVRGNSKFWQLNNAHPEVQPNNDSNWFQYTTNGFRIGISEGYGTGSTSAGCFNTRGVEYMAWTWRVKQHFFDIVTYTGDGNLNRQIAHGLGSQPLFMFIKNLSDNKDAIHWNVGNQTTTMSTWPASMNVNAKFGRYPVCTGGGTADAYVNLGNGSTLIAPTTTHFTVGDASNQSGSNGNAQELLTNGNGKNYVAYLWGNDDSSSSIQKVFVNSMPSSGSTSDGTPQFLFLVPTGTSTNTSSWGRSSTILDKKMGMTNSTRYIQGAENMENGKVTYHGNTVNMLSFVDRNSTGVGLGTDGGTTYAVTSANPIGGGSGEQLAQILVLDPKNTYDNANDNAGLIFISNRRRHNHLGTGLPSGANQLTNNAYKWNDTRIFSTLDTRRDSSRKQYCALGNYRSFTTVSSGSASLYGSSGGESDGIQYIDKTGMGLGDQIQTTKDGRFVAVTIKKSHKFFDAFKYTGNGSNNFNRQISHNLGVTPAMIWIRHHTNNMSAPTFMWHKDMPNHFATVDHESSFQTPNFQNPGSGNQLYGNEIFGGTSSSLGTPTEDYIVINGDWTNNSQSAASASGMNVNGVIYEVYLFADQPNTGNIATGSYIGNGAGLTNYPTIGSQSNIDDNNATQHYGTETSGVNVDLGWEPQFVMIKAMTTSGEWIMLDTTRGWDRNEGNVLSLSRRNTNGNIGHYFDREFTHTHGMVGFPHARGFEVRGTGLNSDYRSWSGETQEWSRNWNKSGERYLYFAVRRPRKVPTAGNEVFATARGSADPHNTASIYSSKGEYKDFVQSDKQRDSYNSGVQDNGKWMGTTAFKPHENNHLVPITFKPDVVILSNVNHPANNASHHHIYTRLTGKIGHELGRLDSNPQYLNNGSNQGDLYNPFDGNGFGEIGTAGSGSLQSFYAKWTTNPNPSGSFQQSGTNQSEAQNYAMMFQRAPGFMDVTVDKITGQSGTLNSSSDVLTTKHNLGVVPEMIISKVFRPTIDSQYVQNAVGGGHPDKRWLGFDVRHKDMTNGLNDRMMINAGWGAWDKSMNINGNSTYNYGGYYADSSQSSNNTITTDNYGTVAHGSHTIGTVTASNSDLVYTGVDGTSGNIPKPTNQTNFYVQRIMFATLAGVSKVGYYLGTGTTTVNVNCGFSGGARFIIIKREDAAGNWYMFDAGNAGGYGTEGIATGNDMFTVLNQDHAHKTGVDVIDPYSQGFAVPANSYTNGTNQYSSSVAAAPINVNGARYIFLAIA